MCVRGQEARGRVGENGGGREGAGWASMFFGVRGRRAENWRRKGRGGCLWRALASKTRPPLGVAPSLAARHHPPVPARRRSNAPWCFSHIRCGGYAETKEEGTGVLHTPRPTPTQTTRIYTLYYKQAQQHAGVYVPSARHAVLPGVPCYCRCEKPSSKASVPPPRWTCWSWSSKRLAVCVGVGWKEGTELVGCIGPLRL